VNLVVAFAAVGIITALAFRMGLLATAACFFATNTLSNVPWTFDSNAWYFAPSAATFIILAALCTFAGYAATASGEPDVRTMR
jgi:hypothetical protein